MKFNLRSLLPQLVNVALRRPVSITTAPSTSTIAADAAAALVTDLILQPPERPSFDIAAPRARAPQRGAARPGPPIMTSDPLIAREARAAGIPVVPPIIPITPAVLASATEGHPMSNEAEVIEKDALKLALPLLGAAIAKYSDADVLALLQKENHTIGTLAVKAVEQVVDGAAKGILGNFAPMIDTLISSNEPAIEGLIASKEAVLVALGRSYLNGLLAKGEAIANS